MQMKRNKKALSCILCMVLIVAMALFTTGCSGSKETGTKTESQQSEAPQKGGETQEEGDSQEAGNSQGAGDNNEQSQLTVKGEGETIFLFTSVDKEGKESVFEIHTDKKIVGEALQEVGLIEGSEGEYGLYVTKVNGLTLDFNQDGYYWAFYVNGEYAMTGVDQTEITEGDSYSFKAEK